MASRYKHDWSTVNAMRAAFESDASVTYASIAEAAGMDMRQISNYARREGWSRSEKVRSAARHLASAAGLKVRHQAIAQIAADFVGPPKPPKPEKMLSVAPNTPAQPPQKNMAVASVFDLGSGRRVTTNRNHEEIKL